MTYVSMDVYLKRGGSLGFVITRSVFQSEIGGWHFRSFCLPSGIPFKVVRVDDLDRLKPFRGRAGNVTASVVLKKGLKTAYPVNYVRWETIARGIGNEDDSLADILAGTQTFNWVAYPVRKEWIQSSWIVGPEKCIDILRTVIAPSPYASLAREGINTRGANGVYFLDVIEERRGQALVKNRAHDGDEDDRVPVVERLVDNDHLFPLLRGRDVGRWLASTSGAVILPHDPEDPVEPIPFNNLERNTQDFLTTFKDKLRSRKRFRNFDPTGKNWHGLYSVLTATFAPFKAVWKEMARGSVASVVSRCPVVPGGEPKVIIPDHKLMIIPARSLQEAHFIAAILNSTVARYIVISFAISTGISTHILDKIPIPQFDDTAVLHKELAQLSIDCHKSASKRDAPSVAELEIAVDKAVAGLWQIKAAELTTIQTTLREFQGTQEDGED